MYGLVNKAIEDLALAIGGQAAWERVQEVAGLEIVEFVSTDVYDDDVTYRLVAAASEVVGVSEYEVLRAFGRHWILYTGRNGYGPVIASFGSTLVEFLGNLDSLHARITLTMPHLRPPRFSHEVAADGCITLTYASERPGLAPMVVGLLEGMGEMFGEPAEVALASSSSQDGTHLATFTIRRAGVMGDVTAHTSVGLPA